ncbi:hypothetical protein JCM33374_g5638 [Metschnikowia sp. JCM 33374]|nr:hypothetical protein JCM33374_g5638 [Metschnikowia sp. JCM 33374]
MSKLDSLLDMVDTIAARSDKLVSSINDSHMLISDIMELNTSISKYDTQIENMSQLVGKNSEFLVEFQKLYEKSFFLESNFGLNDCYTNDTSFSNLYHEYDFLWNEFHMANIKSGSAHVGNPENVANPGNPGNTTKPGNTAKPGDTANPGDTTTTQVVNPTHGHSAEKRVSPERTVKNIISISNLTLKPLRCKESKVSKQKSRYRLSEAYTLNPLQALPVREISESSTNTNYSNIMVTSDQEHYNHDNDDSSFSSNLSDSNSPVSVLLSSEMARTPKFSETGPFENTDPLDPSASPLLFKSLHTSAYNGEDGDGIESSDFEPHSPDSRFEDFDNFHHFLRRSRINLRESFPVLERSKSHESVLTTKAEQVVSSYFSREIPSRKFQNPADMINSQKKSLSSQPTVETIYSKGVDGASKFKEHSARLLASQIEKQAHSDNTVSTPKKTQSFDIFKLMNSPLGSPRGFNRTRTPDKDEDRDCSSSNSNSILSPNVDRRNSVEFLGKSLASSFMNLVNNNSSSPKKLRFANMGLEKNEPEKNSPPDKIKKLKKDLKNPIASRNDIKSKRLPPIDRNLKNGSGSFLTIGPNKTKIINHADSSVFKRPTLRRMSQSLLTDSLNESLFF